MRSLLKSTALLALMICGTMAITAPAHSEVVRRSVTANADGSVTVDKTVHRSNWDGSATTTRRVTTTDNVMTPDSYVYEPASGSSYTEIYTNGSMPRRTVTTTTNVNTETYVLPAYDGDEYFLPGDRRVGQTYPVGEDHQGNNVLRYENKSFDGYNN